MKIISWNVNGINAVNRNTQGLFNFMQLENADIYCFQEIKSTPKTINNELLHLDGYDVYWNRAEKNGYSGVMCYSKIKPLSIFNGIKQEEFDHEGRVMTLEFEDFYLVNSYFVNAQRGLARIDYKIAFNDAVLHYLQSLRKLKPVILCGDLNVAHEEIDLKNPKQNQKNAGFSIEERQWFTKFLTYGYIDTFREFEKNGGHYSWWSYRNDARARNIGWRLDYFVVSQEIRNKIINSEILSEIMGSDHCPIRLILK